MNRESPPDIQESPEVPPDAFGCRQARGRLLDHGEPGGAAARAGCAGDTCTGRSARCGNWVTSRISLPARSRAPAPIRSACWCRPSPIRSSPTRFRACRTTLEPAGFSVILAQSRYDDEREDRMLAALLSRRPEAIIMVGSPATEDGARLLRNARIPVVETWDLPASPIDAVAGFDNFEVGVAVARHLIAQGRQASRFHRRRRSARRPSLARFPGRSAGTETGRSLAG